MTTTDPQKIVCIVPRLGANVGGGKINAVFKRMNLLATREDTKVVLLNLTHGINQKITFAQLKEDGVFDPRVEHHSLYEFCAQPETPTTQVDLPPWDQQIAKAGVEKTRISYFDGDTPVMRDTIEETVAGQVTVRQLLLPRGKETRLKYLKGELIESVERREEEWVTKTFFANGKTLWSAEFESKALRSVICHITHRQYDTLHGFQKGVASQAFPSDCIVFVDGITTAYVSRCIPSQKVLFLHADHRSSDSKLVESSKDFIETFDGAFIVTATSAHKQRLESDLAHAAPIRVIPHYVDRVAPGKLTRKHICTVSRLELDGKPIHQCIEAFVRIQHLIPDTNYLIYGAGIGDARLAQLIKHHKCEDRVFLMGYTPQAEEVFASSLLSLAPTMTEGFGLALLESLSARCPVVSYDVDYGPREMIQSGINGELVKPGDIEGIGNAILKVLANVQSYRSASIQSVERYSFEAYRQGYMGLIDDLVGKQYFFDVAASDLKLQTREALKSAPHAHKERLLDLFIKLASDTRDLKGTYWGFQQKLSLFPKMQRPLMRCIWLSRRLGQQAECKRYLSLFERRFPKHYQDFVVQYPDFLETADA